MKLLGMFMSLVALALVPGAMSLAGLPAQPRSGGVRLVRAAETGSVGGVVKCSGKIKTKGATPQKHVVVYLEKVPGTFAAPAAPVIAKQEKLTFEPHVLAVLKGTTVAFTNGDSVTHNVFSADACCKMDMDTKQGEEAKKVFDTAGAVAIVCRLHPEMSMYVLVLDNPHFQTIELAKKADDDKSTYEAPFKLENVPAGEYVLKTWNKKLQEVATTVKVEAGKESQCELTLEK
jgi:plastocyanin